MQRELIVDRTFKRHFSSPNRIREKSDNSQSVNYAASRFSSVPLYPAMLSNLVFNKRTLPASWLASITLLLIGCSATPLPPVTAVPAVPAPPAASKEPAKRGLSASFFAASCARDTEIDATKRDVIVLAGLSFMEALLGKDPSSAFDLFSKEEQAELTRPRLVEMAAGFHKLFEPKGLAVDHTYFIRLKGKAPDRVVCARDLSKPDGRSSVRVTSTPEQAYVLATGNSHNERLAVTIWLVPEAQVWKVQAFSIYVSSLGRRDAAQILELARKQQALGHDLNALLLHFAAGAISDRGPLLQIGTAQPISEEFSKAKRPPEMEGTPPWSWKDERATFKIMQVGSLGIAGKIYVVIDHEVPPRTTSEEMERANRGLIAHFKRRFPEYADVFAGLLARAHEQGTGRGYGTGDEEEPKHD